MKIFKEYLKHSDRYFPSGEIQALNLVQNLLEDGFSFQGLKYVKRFVDYCDTGKEFDIIKNIGDRYLNKKMIQALTSEMFFDKAYTLVLVLWRSNLKIPLSFKIIKRKSTNDNQKSIDQRFEFY